VSIPLWNLCLQRLERELSAQDFNTWIRPLHAVEEGEVLYLLAPNRFVVTWIREHFWSKIEDLLNAVSGAGRRPQVRLQVGSVRQATPKNQAVKDNKANDKPDNKDLIIKHGVSPLNPLFTFNTFVTGQGNRIACESSQQTAENHVFNPLYLYGGVGLGKTHLMQAVGNLVLKKQPQAKVLYLHSERFVANMVKALQNKNINEFKKVFRSADVLLIDDVQFLTGKIQSQEEFLHTFDTLLDRQRRVVFTSDRAPRELGNMDDRLKSRFGSGMTARIETPDLDTRIAILMDKAQKAQARLSSEVTLFIAQHIDSSIRELEGALHRLLASARIMRQPITTDFAQEILKDLLAVRSKKFTIAEIQAVVAEYFRLDVDELCSKRRQRHIVRSRHIAISLCKELTQLTSPEIGNAFGGRDRTTILHSCKTVSSLKSSDSQTREDYQKLLKILSN
jgi:chromosomal replication initiator protein